VAVTASFRVLYIFVLLRLNFAQFGEEFSNHEWTPMDTNRSVQFVFIRVHSRFPFDRLWLRLCCAVIIEHASRRLLHWNVTSNPTAAWTLQQLREAIASDHPYRFLVHDRDSVYAQALDSSIANLRLRVLKTPYRSPKANSLCERLIGSLQRECLDWAIPLSEGHLRSLLKVWSTYYNRGRPHMALGP
jgi:transposase InsO family protein